MSEQLLDAVSTLNENKQPHLNTCQYIVGDFKIDFDNGRAKVPASIAPVVARDPRIQVFAVQAKPAETIAPSPVEEPKAAVEVPAAPEGVELSDDVKAAMEHLKSEGEEVPEVQVNKTGFEPLTVDGQARCQAAKGDGSQCSNPATAGSACGLSNHQSQVSST